ncbi:hypothetical protein AGMMS50212_00260 [Spirochaetia bacterium]|nr:hypothetical protein AGMMS50212_00260 [Spirochaetia bacterium]
MRKLVFVILLPVSFMVSATAMAQSPNTVFFNTTFNIGSFSAGEYDGGSVFLGGLLSADWIPNGKIGLAYGIETGLLGGKKQAGNSIILGIPVIFRLGWYPSFINIKNTDLFILAKIGWGFGLWGVHLDNGSTPGGIVCGINIGGRYAFTRRIGAYTEIGYNYYGLARNDNYPEYPLGYGSGKIYATAGVSIKIN